MGKDREKRPERVHIQGNLGFLALVEKDIHSYTQSRKTKEIRSRVRLEPLLKKPRDQQQRGKKERGQDSATFGVRRHAMCLSVLEGRNAGKFLGRQASGQEKRKKKNLWDYLTSVHAQFHGD